MINFGGLCLATQQWRVIFNSLWSFGVTSSELVVWVFGVYNLVQKRGEEVSWTQPPAKLDPKTHPCDAYLRGYLLSEARIFLIGEPLGRSTPKRGKQILWENDYSSNRLSFFP